MQKKDFKNAMNFESLSQVKFLLIRKHEICFWSQSLRISFCLFAYFSAVRKWTKTSHGIKAKTKKKVNRKWANEKISLIYIKSPRDIQRGFNGAVFLSSARNINKKKFQKNASRKQRFIIYKASFKLNSCPTNTKKKQHKNVSQHRVNLISWRLNDICLICNFVVENCLKKLFWKNLCCWKLNSLKVASVRSIKTVRNGVEIENRIFLWSKSGGMLTFSASKQFRSSNNFLAVFKASDGEKLMNLI